MKDLETEREGLFLESSFLVDWRVREDLESSVSVDLSGGGISFVTVRVRPGRGGSEFGNGGHWEELLPYVYWTRVRLLSHLRYFFDSLGDQKVVALWSKGPNHHITLFSCYQPFHSNNINIPFHPSFSTRMC